MKLCPASLSGICLQMSEGWAPCDEDECVPAGITAEDTGSFDETLERIRAVTKQMKMLKALQETLLAKADSTSPHANRRAMGAAADLVPSQLLVVLERNGRPRNRTKP